MLQYIQSDILKVKWLKRHSVECFSLYVIVHIIFFSNEEDYNISCRQTL